MTDATASFLTGTMGLSIALTFALWLTLSRPRPAVENLGRIRRAAMAGVVLQAAHFTEELLTGFHQQFPAILGLAAWSPGLFTAFNLAWLAGWVMSIAALRRWPKTATFPLWFLGLAAVVNGLAHPLLSAATADYFPGTWSSLFLAIAGVYLLRELAAATRATAATR